VVDPLVIPFQLFQGLGYTTPKVRVIQPLPLGNFFRDLAPIFPLRFPFLGGPIRGRVIPRARIGSGVAPPFLGFSPGGFSHVVNHSGNNIKVGGLPRKIPHLTFLGGFKPFGRTLGNF